MVRSNEHCAGRGESIRKGDKNSYLDLLLIKFHLRVVKYGTKYFCWWAKSQTKMPAISRSAEKKHFKGATSRSLWAFLAPSGELKQELKRNRKAKKKHQGRSQDCSKGRGGGVTLCQTLSVGCFLKKRLTKGGGVTGTPGPPSLRP